MRAKALPAHSGEVYTHKKIRGLSKKGSADVGGFLRSNKGWRDAGDVGDCMGDVILSDPSLTEDLDLHVSSACDDCLVTTIRRIQLNHRLSIY